MASECNINTVSSFLKVMIYSSVRVDHYWIEFSITVRSNLTTLD